MTHDDSVELVERYKKGDQKAANALFERSGLPKRAEDRAIEVLGDVGDLSVTEGEHVRELHLDRYSAARAVAAQAPWAAMPMAQRREIVLDIGQR